MQFNGKKILISGGSSGIGKALITELYLAGARDFAVIGRDPRKMEALQPEFPEGVFTYLVGDVGSPETIRNFAKTISDQWGSLDILINNAGVVSAGLLETITDEDVIAQININTIGLILLTKHTLPLLKKSMEAVIMNVSSGLGLIGMPFYATYAASKAGVRQFSEAVRRELKDFPIHVMTVYPTATDTPMMRTASVTGMDTPETVAIQALNGLIDKQINVVLGGERQLHYIKLNFEDPLEFDKHVALLYHALESRASSHRSM